MKLLWKEFWKLHRTASLDGMQQLSHTYLIGWFNIEHNDKTYQVHYNGNLFAPHVYIAVYDVFSNRELPAVAIRKILAKRSKGTKKEGKNA